ncbi:MAG: hypothetical protein M3O34_15450 [Chloroflexota bacterium]|nr:hypothetical protein [Chloroflexota bacterium]
MAARSWSWPVAGWIALAATLAAVLAVVLTGRAASAQATASCDNVSRPDLEFHCVRDGLGFTIANEGARRLLDVYRHLGGANVLGQVRSQPFKSTRPELQGYWFQATERFLIQFPDAPDADPVRDGGLANTLELAHSPANAQWDAILLAQYGIPKPTTWADRPGLDPAEIARLRVQTVFGPDAVNPSIRAAADQIRGALDAWGTYGILGLPMSTLEAVTVNGTPKVCLRLQRAGLCRTTTTGFTDPVWAGAELISRVGFMQPEPANAFEPAPPPGTARVQIRAPEEVVRLYEPMPGPLALLCGLPLPGAAPCGPAAYSLGAQVYEDSVAGRGPIKSAEGLALTASVRNVETGELVLSDVPVAIGPDGQAALPSLTADRPTTYEAALRLAGRYLGVTVPSPIEGQEPRARFRATWVPYPRVLGQPAIVVYALLLVVAALALVALFRALRGFLVARSRLPMPAYTVTVAGQPIVLDQYPDKVIPWSPWLLGRKFVDGKAIGAPGLRFGTDAHGSPYVAGRGLKNGAPISRFRGTAVSDGDQIVLTGERAGSVVLIGDSYGGEDWSAAPAGRAGDDAWGEPIYAGREEGPFDPRRSTGGPARPRYAVGSGRKFDV